MNKNLYKTLGINKKANKNDIKKAYRDKAKKHHPDRNGNSSAFIEINKAHSILIDDKKRRLYDETGQTGENIKSKIAGAAHDRLCKIFLEIIDKKGEEIFQTDIIDIIEKNISNFIKQCKSIISKTKKEEKHLKKIKKRIKYRGKGINLFITILEDKIKHCKLTIYQAEFDIKIFNKMSKIIKNFEFEFDKVKENTYTTPRFIAGTWREYQWI